MNACFLIKKELIQFWLSRNFDRFLFELLIDKLNIKRSDIPAVTHIDYSARIQTVDHNTNKRYYDLISKFKEKIDKFIIVKPKASDFKILLALLNKAA